MENHFKAAEKLIIDDTPPKVSVEFEKSSFRENTMDLRISGKSNEEVDLEINLPVHGESYFFHSTKDSINGKVMYSFTYDIFDIDIKNDSLKQIGDFVVEFKDLANNSIIHREDPELFFKIGSQTWSTQEVDFLIEKRILDKNSSEFAQTLATNNSKNKLISDDFLRVTVTLVSSKHIVVNWKLREELDNVT